MNKPNKRAVKVLRKALAYLSVKSHFDPDETDEKAKAVCVYGALIKFDRKMTSFADSYLTSKERITCINWSDNPLTWGKAKTMLKRAIKRALKGKNQHVIEGV